MKRETLRHPKTYDLAARLNCSRPEALGFLTLLWDFTADSAPEGNVGKWPNGAIARSCEWTGDPDDFVHALIESGWLDDDDTHRLVIHDIHDHAEQWWKQKLTKLGKRFVTDPAVRSAVPTAVATAEATAADSVPSAVDTPPCDRTKPNLTKPNQTTSAEPSSDDPAGTEFSFRVVGGGPPEWQLPRVLYDSFCRDFPGVDVDTQLRNARSWCETTPTKRKTARGMPKFLSSWLARHQNQNARGSPATDTSGGTRKVRDDPKLHREVIRAQIMKRTKIRDEARLEQMVDEHLAKEQACDQSA